MNVTVLPILWIYSYFDEFFQNFFFTFFFFFFLQSHKRNVEVLLFDPNAIFKSVPLRTVFEHNLSKFCLPYVEWIFIQNTKREKGSRSVQSNTRNWKARFGNSLVYPTRAVKLRWPRIFPRISLRKYERGRNWIKSSRGGEGDETRGEKQFFHRVFLFTRTLISRAALERFICTAISLINRSRGKEKGTDFGIVGERASIYI